MALNPQQEQLRWAFMLGAAGRGLSANATLRELRDVGLGMGRTRGLAMFKQALAYVEQAPQIAALDQENPISPENATEWPSRTKEGFGYVVQFNITHQGTGVTDTRFHTVFSDQLLSPGQAARMAVDANADKAAYYEYDVNSAFTTNIVNYVPMEL